MKRFGQLKAHESQHPCFGHVFNPYLRRCASSHLDDDFFNRVVCAERNGVSADYVFHGCLDAPDEIPMGSAQRIMTIGKFEREEYSNLPRGTEDWKQWARAGYEVAQMLQEILEEGEGESESGMKHATYIGPDTGWNITAGMTALVRPSDKPGVVLAQFDDFAAQREGVDQAFGWHEYPEEQFKIDEELT